MGEHTNISYCQHTFNAVIGCHEVSTGCANCFAKRSTAARVARSKGIELWNKDGPRQRTSKAYWKQPFAWDKAAKAAGERHRVLNTLNDPFDPAWPIEVLADYFDLIRRTDNLDWLMLTKRIEHWGERVRWLRGWLMYSGLSKDVADGPYGPSAFWIDKYPAEIAALRSLTPEQHKTRRIRWAAALDLVCGWTSGDVECAIVDGKLYDVYNAPSNVWLGVTVEGPDQLYRIDELLKTPARKHWISFEPLVGEVKPKTLKGIDWVVVGGESGPQARPMHPDWVRYLRDLCRTEGIPFYFKQWGEWEEFDPGLPIQQLDLQTHRYRAERYWEMATSPCLIDLNGKVYNSIADLPDNDTPHRLMSRVGKTRAGHLLDGGEYHTFPQA